MNNSSLIKLSNADMWNKLATMTTDEFNVEAKLIIDFCAKFTKWLIAEDKEILETAKQMLTDGKLESFEERKYFMEIMRDTVAKINKKKALVGLSGAGLIGICILRHLNKKNT